jgi:hypothetical protein
LSCRSPSTKQEIQNEALLFVGQGLSIFVNIITPCRRIMFLGPDKAMTRRAFGPIEPLALIKR